MDDADHAKHSADTFDPKDFLLRDGRKAVLRCSTEEDAAAFCEFMPKSHAECDFLNDLPGEFKKTIEEEKEFLREKSESADAVALVVEVDGRLVGCCGAWSQDLQRYAHHAELGLTVRKEFWGQGIGRNMMDAIIRWGASRGLRKIYLKVMADNDPAINLYRSLGFVEEGRLREDVLRGDGGYRDTMIMAKYYVVP